MNIANFFKPNKKKNVITQTAEQTAIITSTFMYMMIEGVPGCGKTETLVLRLVERLNDENAKKENIMMLTKVTSVTETLVKRIKKYIPEIKFTKQSKSRVFSEYNGHNIEICNVDAFIDCQLRFYEKEGGTFKYNSDGIIKEEKRSLRDKNSGLGKNMKRKKEIFSFLVQKDDIKIVMKNDKKKQLFVDRLILDEVQDFSQEQAIIFLLLVTNNRLYFEGYGDNLQSIWYEYTENELTNDFPKMTFKIFQTIKSMQKFTLSKCFRCPYYHCKFLEIVNRKPNKKYIRKKIQSFAPKPQIGEADKPMYFSHPSLNNNNNCQITAKIIIKIIKTVLKNDKNMGIGNVMILLTKINESALVSKIKEQLHKNDLPFVAYETKGSGGETISINMDLLKEKNCSRCNEKFQDKYKETHCRKCGTKRKQNKAGIISAHGYKGGENTIIIAPGLSEGACPMNNHPGTPNELKDFSIFNVIPSRSKKYLFFGSNLKPSRYITNNMEDLADYIYITQDFQGYMNKNIADKYKGRMKSVIKKLIQFHIDKNVDKINELELNYKEEGKKEKKLKKTFRFLKFVAINDLTMPTVYKEVSKNLQKTNIRNNFPQGNYPLDFLLKKNETKLNIPNESNLTVTKVSESFDKIKSLNNIKDDCIQIEKQTFGDNCNIDYSDVTSSRIIGNLPNVYLSLKNKDAFYYYLVNVINGQVAFIDTNSNSGILDVLKDCFSEKDFLTGISFLNIREKMSEKPDYLNKDHKLSPKYQEMINYLKKKIFTRNGNFQSLKKILLLPDYFKNVFQATDIINDNKQLWNLCLLYDYVYFRTYEESSYKINNDAHFFRSNLQTALKNMDIFNEKYSDSGLELEIPCVPIAYLERDPDILYNKLLIDKKYNSWPCSIGGRMDSRDKKEVLEFKMSVSKDCKDEWIVQVILYMLLGGYIPEKSEEDDDGQKIVIQQAQVISLETATLYNFMTGEKYKINFDKRKFIKSYKKRFFNQVLKDGFNFITPLRKNFLDKIESSNVF